MKVAKGNLVGVYYRPGAINKGYRELSSNGGFAMNIRALFHSQQSTGRSGAHRCKPQLETLDDRMLPSGFMVFGMPNPEVTYAAVVAFAKRAMLQAQADLNQAAQTGAGQTADRFTVSG